MVFHPARLSLGTSGCITVSLPRLARCCGKLYPPWYWRHPAGGMRVPGQSPVARMPGTGRFVPRAWSSYPFFESGTVIVTSLQDGLDLPRITAFVSCTKRSVLTNNHPWQSFTVAKCTRLQEDAHRLSGEVALNRKIHRALAR